MLYFLVFRLFWFFFVCWCWLFWADLVVLWCVWCFSFEVAFCFVCGVFFFWFGFDVVFCFCWMLWLVCWVS